MTDNMAKTINKYCPSCEKVAPQRTYEYVKDGQKYHGQYCEMCNLQHIPVKMKKELSGMADRTFIIYGDPVHEAVIVGDVEGLLEYIRSVALELADGESAMCTITRTIKRRDMTKDEIEASPVI